MEFVYFAAPSEEMSAFSAEPVRCHFCGKSGPAFSLDFAHCPELCVDEDGPLHDERKGKYGCYRCLRASRFEVHHDTEVGHLDESGLHVRRDVSAHRPPDPEAVQELRRTPDYVTWQGACWRLHCGDFMVYLGIWSPANFVKQAANSDGRALFMEMTDADEAHLWDEAIDADEEPPDDWSAAYYAFKCRLCGAYRGHWDCD